MWKEFKEFAFKGNVIDLAVGVMIGGAFGKIVTSLVNDLFTPLLSGLTGGVDFSNLAVKLGAGEGAPMLTYGAFIQSVIDFLLIAVCIFLFVKALSKLRKPAPAAVKAPARLCPYCKTAIHDEATRCPHCTSQLD
ncbi:MAG: large conductance mechanosensitive channel protein MscL [Clostridiales bacterium]|nr:large conductance mechanosensitive channel protein MscL [Clostridiales bacterium]